MHIFITGVAGFLGSNLADYYIAKGYKVTGCDNLVGGDMDNLHPKVIFHKTECENLKKMVEISKGADVVIHAAAYAHESLSVFSPNLICSNIINASTSVFSAAIQNNVKRIVFCSSIARYGHIKPPFKESDTPNPVDPYGISKLAAEKILINLCNTYGVEYNIAIPHNIIGVKQKYDDPFRNVASIMINLMLQNRKPIIYGDGEQQRSFSDVDDCIYCIDKLATDPNIKNDIFNIGPGTDSVITINHLYELISNELQFNQKPIYEKKRVNEVKHAICSSEKSDQKLNYINKKDTGSMIKKMCNYIKSRGHKKFNYSYEIEIKKKGITPDVWLKKII